MLAASPREDSGTHAKRRSEGDGCFERPEAEDVGLAPSEGFCWRRAMYPGILSFADGEGCMYTYASRELDANYETPSTAHMLKRTLLLEYSSLTPRPLLEWVTVL